MTKQRIYLSVDIDREIFLDQTGREYSVREVKGMFERRELSDYSAKVFRVVYDFDYDFKKARAFYETKS